MVKQTVLKRVLSGFATLAVVSLLSPQFGFTAPVPAGTYILGDHPDGALFVSPNTSGPNGPYGLRVDSLPGEPGPTFSVEQGGAEVLLSWDGGSTATITGQVRHNLTLELWDVEHVLTGVVADPGGMGFRATGGTGNLSLNGVEQTSWEGKQDGSGFAFLFLGDGHRLDGDNDSTVGRGWLNLDGTNDWLVTASPVPSPSAFILFGTGLGGLVLLRYRKNRS